VIECAWRYGVPVRCVWLTTTLADAQVNAVNRLLAVHGSLPAPDELRARAKSDHRYLGPDALFRYVRQLEPPTPEEGFTSIERPAFQRRTPPGHAAKALLLELDGVVTTGTTEADSALVPDRREALARYAADGWLLLALAWRPQVARGELTREAVEEGLARVRALLALPIDIAVCPHDAGPAICWCRKPLPGLALELFARHAVDPVASTVVGRAPADRTLAERLGASYVDHDDFFSNAHSRSAEGAE
jgi:histidinol phosphatase-like enzyme